jgi:peptide-methionine (R)-S-oxide reductase
MINWNDVLNFANKGNPLPDRRIEKSEEEWKAVLTSMSKTILTDPAA